MKGSQKDNLLWDVQYFLKCIISHFWNKGIETMSKEILDMKMPIKLYNKIYVNIYETYSISWNV